MKVIETGSELRAELAAERALERHIGFVATMGYLHEGHLSLVRAARDACDCVVISIFVNPLQFLPGEDFDTYPRDPERDVALAEREKVDFVFVPSVEEMYAPDRSTLVRVGRLGDRYEGASRPGHFDGVATVVAKLLNIVQPHIAYFGQKDAQQLAVVKRMVADLSLPVDIVACPTVREPDGLALSSRNVYLGGDDRRQATVLWRALRAGRDALAAGADVPSANDRMFEGLASAPMVEPEYAAVVDPDTFDEPIGGRDRLLIVAARLGRTRLIDNLLLPSGGEGAR